VTNVGNGAPESLVRGHRPWPRSPSPTTRAARAGSPPPRRSADGYPLCPDCAARPLSESWHYRRRPQAIAGDRSGEELPKGCVRTAAGLVVEAREIDPAAEAAERARRVELYARRWSELEARGVQRTVFGATEGIG
jgi:hypothetical protein